MSSESAQQPPRSSSPGPRASRTNRVVCTACRQSKVRCVGTENEDCARCMRLGLDCHRDTNFKRVSKSRKIAELEKQVQLLTSAFTGSSNQSPQSPQVSVHQQSHVPPSFASQPTPPAMLTRTPSQDVSGRTVSRTPQYQNPGLQGPSVMSIFHIDESPRPRPGAALSRSIQSAYLTGQTIDELFEIFFEHYHPALPFLNPAKSPDDYYDSGTILFWVIISIASRRYTNDMLLFPVLCEWIPKLIWESISSPPYTIPMVQAIILACTWPFPMPSMWNDTIVTLSSIAVSTAMQLGLHRPLNATDFLRKKATADENDSQTRAFTWAAANIVSQSIEATYGVLPTTPFDRTIEASCKPGNMYSLPNILRFKLAIFRYCNRISNLVCRDLTDNGDPFSPGTPQTNPTLSWVTELLEFETRMQSWKQKYRDQLSFHDEIYAAAAAVYTTSMYFFDSTSSAARKHNILKAYRTSTSYIQLLTSFDQTSNYLLHAPSYPLKIFVLACCVLLKVLRSSYAADVDFEEGKRLCNLAIIAANKSSVAPQDSAGKVAKMVSQVWHSGDLRPLGEMPVLMVKSRLGASILYDFIWTWRQEFGGQQGAYPREGDGMEPETEDILLPTDGVFDDASMVDLDFLNDPDWMESITNSIG
ncbi:uncharacterized protein LY89DRAFT_789497 [Mollisia scopiformis]|uniref:Zn(2)-C6 fungal-type domain-containing protein n=1 Tax=Mollisia scopiformis TaxID=149040 RepID=A0A132B7I0_MOLSC|nr:uncharacterized protein LY89DRAFT_789497 [Mollisia scopiformis]KUJ07834.1 hypothetical protein LY89DRAFT_789497 [Mollisia scopiformis]